MTRVLTEDLRPSALVAMMSTVPAFKARMVDCLISTNPSSEARSETSFSSAFSGKTETEKPISSPTVTSVFSRVSSTEETGIGSREERLLSEETLSSEEEVAGSPPPHAESSMLERRIRSSPFFFISCTSRASCCRFPRARRRGSAQSCSDNRTSRNRNSGRAGR